MRITPENITELPDNHIFVFGDNEAHLHGAGAAKQALKWGAKYYKGGLVGKTYGIPTKSKKLEVLSLRRIQKHIDEFAIVAENNPKLIFLVTAIGTGLSGYKHEDIAPLFIKVISVPNIHLPFRFWEILKRL